jgi:hypothetical protein
MVNSFMIWIRKLWWFVLHAILVSPLILVACARSFPTPVITEAPQLATPDLLPTSTSAPLPATNTASPNQLSNNELVIPLNWYSTTIDQPNLAGYLFVKHDPANLASFDDPTLAVPADFAGGALINTPLPPEADADNLQANMEANLSKMTDQDFEAMLIGADQIGLINLAAVSHGRLHQAQLDTLGGQPAILLEGTIHFAEEQPPILLGQIWLTWTGKSFTTFYALGTEAIWPSIKSELEDARQSFILP